MKDHVYNFRLPIFDPCNVWLVVTDHVGHARSQRDKVLGRGNGVDYHGLSCWDEKGKFFLFFQRTAIDHQLIAHEVFHATHRMLEYCCHNLTPNAHEPHAYLCGFLTATVYRKLRHWHIPVALEWKRIAP